MREKDSKCSKLAKAQANLFVDSLTKYTGSSAIFIKRFMYSKEASNIDRNAIFDSAKIYVELNEKDLSYGKEKYSENIMHWIGYIYRYFAYLYEIPSKKIYQIINAKEMASLYRAYHTMDPKFAIDRILEQKNLDLNNSVEYQYELYKQLVMQEDFSKEYVKSIKKARKENISKMKKYNPKEKF